MCDDPHSNEMSLVDESHQLMDAASIKQEPDIKEEPQSIGDLVEATHSDHCDDGQSSAHYNRFENENNPMNLSIDEVKIEIKDETGESSKKDQKSNDSNGNNKGEATDSHRGNSSRQQPNRIDGNVSNFKKPTKGNAQVKAPQQHQCKQCEYSTNHLGNLKSHLLTHTGEKPFPCDHCEKAFTSKQNLQFHLKVHAKEFQFHCAVCFMGFDQKNEKIIHEIHCNTRRYECHLCNKSFGSKKIGLIEHMLVHSGSKPFECEECSKQFTTKGSLKEHMKFHGGPSSFRCLICLEGFTQQNEVIEHELKCNRCVYECYVCGKSFGLGKVNLARHMTTHTGIKPFKCNQCPLKFTHKSNLNRHIRIHSRSLPWKCMICHQGFLETTQCKAHQRNCRRRVYECYVCEKFFGSNCNDLKSHMRTHTGKKPFQCEICSIRFAHKSSLTIHKKTIHDKTR